MMQHCNRAAAVADMLVHHFGGAEATGASVTDIADGYRLAAERVAAWAEHKDWPSLRDNLTYPPLADRSA